MNKKIIEVLTDALPQPDVFVDCYRHFAILSDIFTIDGKDLKSLLDLKDIESFSIEDFCKIRINTNARFTNDELLKCFDGFPENVKVFYKYNYIFFLKVVKSVINLIPPKREKRDAEIMESIAFFLITANIYVNDFESIQQLYACYIDQSSNIIDPQKNKICMATMVFCQSMLFFFTIHCILFHNAVYEYFYGSSDKRDENADMIKQIASTLNAIKKTMNEMKENQNEIKELVEKRNEGEKPKRLQIAKCAKDIGRILQNEYHTYVNKKTIEKYLHRLDTYLEKGIKIPLPTYKYAMYYDKNNFIVWCRETFIPYYLEHRKIRVKNKTPRRSSSDAAADEAARQKYKEEEEENDSY